MKSRILLLFSLLVTLLIYTHPIDGTYTVTADQYNNLPLVYGSAYTSINGTIYSYGGKTITSEGVTIDSGDLYQISIPNPTHNGSDLSYTLLSSHGNASFGQMVYLAQTQSLLMIGGAIPINATNPPLVMSIYHLINSSWSSPPIHSPAPPNRQRFGAALSKVNNLVYIYGGLSGYAGDSYLSDFWSYNPITGVFNNLTSTLPSPAAQASSLVSLSNGNLMVMFGLQQVNNLYSAISASKIPTFNVNTNQWTLTTTQNPGYQRCGATTMLSPNESSIVAFGGDNCAGILYQAYTNRTHILDLATNSWQQQQQQPNGITPRARTWAFGGFLDSNHILVSGGVLNIQAFNDINVLSFPLIPGQSPQWVKTYYQDLFTDESNSINGGRIAGIVIGVVLGTLLLGLFVWKCGRYIRYVILNLHYDIWRPRTGEPLWTETSRVISQVFLFFLFLVFTVYIGIQVRDSPTNILTIDKEVAAVTTPNIRICTEGYHDPTLQSAPSILCFLDDGTNCNFAIRALDSTIEKPVYLPSLGPMQCYYYHAYSNITIGPALETPTNTGTKMSFTIYGGNGSLPGAIHVDAFAPGWDPIESIFYNLPTYMSPLDISNWRNDDHNNLLVENSYTIQSGQTMTVNYQLEIYERLTGSAWNYIGLAPQFETTTQLITQQRTTLTNPILSLNQPIATIYVMPQAMLNRTLREAKMFSVISALSYIGGLFSLFLAVQTLLFGYRPSSPFGVVHRWSVGDMKRSISDGLVSRFSSLQTPVPMVNPVHRRFSKLDIKSYGNMNQGPLHSGDYHSNDPLDSLEKGTTLENEPLTPIGNEETRLARMEVMEERLQLLELLFKSYYINDEVFQSLDKALKKDKQRSSMVAYTPPTATTISTPNTTQTTLAATIPSNENILTKSNDDDDTSDNEKRRMIKKRRKSWISAFKTNNNNSGTTMLWDLRTSSANTDAMPSLANPTRDFVPPTPSPTSNPHTLYSEASSYLTDEGPSSHQPQYQEQRHDHHYPQ
ncbi:hypothetical protein BC941DRAFT_473121 [Chlamydoabsidia padenii]|nr:hypothetical protein BC941DRAFT_473121 [Chlamydoabsidia padenii]